MQKPESLEAFKERVKEPGSDGNCVAMGKSHPEPVEDWETSSFSQQDIIQMTLNNLESL